LLKEETGWNNKQTRLALTQARKRNNEWLKKRAYGLLQLQFTSPPLYRFSLYAYLIPLTYLFDNLSGRESQPAVIIESITTYLDRQHRLPLGIYTTTYR